MLKIKTLEEFKEAKRETYFVIKKHQTDLVIYLIVVVVLLALGKKNMKDIVI